MVNSKFQINTIKFPFSLYISITIRWNWFPFLQLFYSFFKSLVGKDVVVELKNDLRYFNRMDLFLLFKFHSNFRAKHINCLKLFQYLQHMRHIAFRRPVFEHKIDRYQCERHRQVSTHVVRIQSWMNAFFGMNCEFKIEFQIGQKLFHSWLCGALCAIARWRSGHTIATRCGTKRSCYQYTLNEWSTLDIFLIFLTVWIINKCSKKKIHKHNWIIEIISDTIVIYQEQKLNKCSNLRLFEEIRGYMHFWFYTQDGLGMCLFFYNSLS